MPEEELVYDDNETNKFYRECSDNLAVTIVLICANVRWLGQSLHLRFTQGLFLLTGVFLAYKTRKVFTLFNESAWIAKIVSNSLKQSFHFSWRFKIWNIALVGGLTLVISYSLTFQPNTVFIIISLVRGFHVTIAFYWRNSVHVTKQLLTLKRELSSQQQPLSRYYSCQNSSKCLLWGKNCFCKESITQIYASDQELAMIKKRMREVSSSVRKSRERTQTIGRAPSLVNNGNPLWLENIQFAQKHDKLYLWHFGDDRRQRTDYSVVLWSSF
jgi:hypothetical protein